MNKAARKKRLSLLLYCEIIIGIIFAVTFKSIPQSFDLGILHFFYLLRFSTLNSVMVFISMLGGVGMIYVGILVVIFLFMIRRRSEAFLLILMTCVAQVVDVILKIIIQRPRPQFYPLVIERDYSFPSGHAMTSFVFYLTISYLIFHLTRNKRLSLISFGIFSIIILLIGISRVYLGVHYPTDVVAGYWGGLIVLTAAARIQNN